MLGQQEWTAIQNCTGAGSSELRGYYKKHASRFFLFCTGKGSRKTINVKNKWGIKWRVIQTSIYSTCSNVIYCYYENLKNF